ncbi:MAG: type II secretion system F family protein [Planctomycetes bacterium]|nr:type II secretion system F family protein [Planctomycetota bacterium]
MSQLTTQKTEVNSSSPGRRSAPETEPENQYQTDTNYALRSVNVKVKSDDLIMFVTQLSVMLDSGVILSDALDAIIEQLENSGFKSVLEDLSEIVKSGDTFSRALGVYPKVFNSMFISMVKASEESGKMSEMLAVLSSYLEFEAETKKQIKGAMTYPFIMALMAVAATGTLMFFVLPRFMKIYETKGQSLPKLTQMLVSFSKFLGDPEKLTITVTMLICSGVGLYWWLSTESGKKAVDFLKIRIPVIGTMFIDTVITRSMRIMSTMLNTGVNVLDTIDVIKSSCDNYYFQQMWSNTGDKICDGYQLSESIKISEHGNLVAPGIIQMLKAGEESGKLGEVSDKISIFYSKKLECSIKSVMSLIEPVMIIVLGSIIGTIAIALLLPIFKISSVITQ